MKYTENVGQETKKSKTNKQTNRQNQKKTPPNQMVKSIYRPQKKLIVTDIWQGTKPKGSGLSDKICLEVQHWKGRRITQVNFRKEKKCCTSNMLFTRKCRIKQSHLPYTENLKGKDILEPYLMNCWKAFYYSLKKFLQLFLNMQMVSMK